MEKFDFSSALMHFRNTQGPGSFVWKWLALYIGAMVAVYAIFGLFFFDVFLSLGPSAVGTTTEISNEAALSIVGRTLGMMAIILPLTALIISVFEASALRRYIRREAFSLKIGKDEFRVFGVLLCWFGLSIIAYIFMAIATMILGVVAMVISMGIPSLSVIMAFLIQIPIFAVFAFFGVKFSPASAVTIRDDNKVTFFSARTASEGRFWPMFGAFALVIFAVYAIQFVLQFVLLVPMMTSLATSSEVVFTPMLIASYTFISAIGLVMTCTAHLIFLGITSRAAITDPTWTGQGGIVAETFD